MVFTLAQQLKELIADMMTRRKERIAKEDEERYRREEEVHPCVLVELPLHALADSLLSCARRLWRQGRAARPSTRRRSRRGRPSSRPSTRRSSSARRTSGSRRFRRASGKRRGGGPQSCRVRPTLYLGGADKSAVRLLNASLFVAQVGSCGSRARRRSSRTQRSSTRETRRSTSASTSAGSRATTRTRSRVRRAGYGWQTCRTRTRARVRRCNATKCARPRA